MTLVNYWWGPDLYVSTADLSAGGTWKHVAATWDGSTHKMFVDGSQVSSQAASRTTSFNTAHFHIGATTPTEPGGCPTASDYFSGAIDDVRIWNVARTQAELSANMSTCLTGNESGLKALYRFDEGSGSSTADWAPSTGKIANNGALTNSPSWVAGVMECSADNALDFDGTDDNVSLPYVARPDTMTLEAWVQIPNPATNGMVVGWAGNTGNSSEFIAFSGSIRYCEWDGSTFPCTPSMNIADGAWHHVAVTRIPDQATLYVDGNLVGSSAMHTGIVTDTLNIGAYNWLGGIDRLFRGKIDEVRLWNVAKTQAEIQATMDTFVFPSDPSLVFYHRMDHGVPGGNNAGVTTSSDLSGNGYNGTLSDFALNGASSNWVAGRALLGPPPPTSTPTPTNTPSSTPTNTPTATPTSTPTNTPTATPTDTPTNTPTSTPTATPTATPTDTPTATPTDTPTNTPTNTPTATPTDTPTNTPTATPTDTPTNTPTNTPTATPTDTPTNTPTATPTDTPTNTPTSTPTDTPTSTPTNTPTVGPGLVVISQVYGGGGAPGAPWKHDFIELFNRGSTPANLAGWSIQYANSASSTWQMLALSGILQPGQYSLIKQGGSLGNGANLPSPDAASTFLMDAVQGKVALVPNTTRLTGLCPAPAAYFDFVAYGAAVNCYEVSRTTDASAANSIQRLGNGCQDTNDNGADFFAQTAVSPGPRNSAYPASPCVFLTPTNTPIPTNTSTPTRTFTPTNTPTPTNTSPPTNTPLSTLTPTVTFTPTVTPIPVGGQMVISQVYSGGGNGGSPWKNDYIELFNRGTGSVDLTGWSVQYANTASVTWQVTALSGTLNPGQYYLVKEGGGAGVGAALPLADAGNTSLMHNTLGKVALVNGTTSLAGLCPAPGTYEDFVGYGAAVTCAEGSSPTADLSNATAAVRSGGGCTDTNNNAADFTVTGAASPGPRNGAFLPLNPCGSLSSGGHASGARAASSGALQAVELSGTVDSLSGSWAFWMIGLLIGALSLWRRPQASSTR